MLKSLSKEEINFLRKKCFEDLYFFAKAVLGFDWLDVDVHLPLCRILESYHKNPRVKIVLPRGWLKTTLCSQAYPVWRAIRNPNIRVLLTQNTFTNSVQKFRVIRDVYERNILFRLLFPELLPTDSCVWKSESLCQNRPKAFDESTFEAAGVRTQVTSRHYDLIIEDDTVAPDYNELGEQNVCPTKEDIEMAIGWHRLALPLLNSPLESQILVVGTRWFEKDLLSWIDENEKYVSYSRAMLETNGVADMQGAPVYPKRFNSAVIEQLKAGYGPYLFSCLCMNQPVRSTEMIFNPDWFTYYEEEPQLSDLVCYTTVDVAGDPEETKGNPDYNTVVTTGKSLVTGRIYVLGYFRKRCNPGEVIDAIFKHVRQWHPLKVGIESVAYQGTIQYWIRERMRKENYFFFVEGFTHGKREKNARIMGLQPVISSGNLLIRKQMVDLVNELIAFPNGAYDDIIDGLSSQIKMWAMTRSKQEIKAERASDPFDFNSVLAEIQNKHRENLSPPFDMLATSGRYSNNWNN